MRIILTIMILYLNIGGYGQNCLEDVPRQCNYSYIELLNNKTGEYEKFPGSKETSLEVTIISEEKIIKFIDSGKNYTKTFTIIGCLVSKETLTYECIDQDSNRKCSLTFGSTDNSYELVVKYDVAPIVYKVSQIKNTN